jgi:hypothetical protein
MARESQTHQFIRKSYESSNRNYGRPFWWHAQPDPQPHLRAEEGQEPEFGLIGCAEEKREKRNAKRLETALRVEADAAAFAGRPRGMVSIHTRYGVGPYNVPEYFAERDAIRAAIDAHNTEFNPKGKKPNPKKSLAADSLLRLAADEKPAKIAKNDRRKQRAAILSLAAIARLPKERNTVKKKAFKGVGTPRAKH